MIYLDHAATTRPDDAVIEAMAEAMRRCWANPSAPYAAAGEARRALRQARAAVAGMLNAAPQEVLFTSSGTEANNQAALLAGGGHAVVSAIEHASVLNAVKARAASVTLVPPGPDGIVRPEAVVRAIRPDTKLISVMLANNETGVIQPVGEIAGLAHARRIPMHCDAVQAFGQVPVDVRALGVDMLTLSGHKLYGPRGIGALWARQGVPLQSLLRGGGQEQGLRSGTEDVAAACGLGVAAQMAQADMAARAARERKMLAAFAGAVRAGVPEVRLLCEASPRLPGLCAMLLPGISSEEAVAALDMMGVQVSGGAACASRDRAVSHVYRALGLTDNEARRVIRVSIGRHTTSGEMECAAAAIVKVCREHREN